MCLLKDVFSFYIVLNTISEENRGLKAHDEKIFYVLSDLPTHYNRSVLILKSTAAVILQFKIKKKTTFFQFIAYLCKIGRVISQSL